jgi:hypothetical protein
MRRTCLLICFALTLSAQDINNRNNPPMAVAARATTVDIEPGDAKPGLLPDIKNVSSQDIRSYMIVISFTDPVTGKPMGRQRHSVNTNHSDGTALAPGVFRTEPKPVILPHSLNGTVPAYSINVDHVVFTDGTSWSGSATQTP